MAIRKIVKRGNAALEKQCRPVDAFNKRLEILLGDLADTMYDAGGVGLAAPQVGILRRAVVVDVATACTNWSTRSFLNGRANRPTLKAVFPAPASSGWRRVPTA